VILQSTWAPLPLLAAAPDTPGGIIDLLAKAGPTAILVYGLYLILTGKLVAGKTHDRVVAERDKLLELAITNSHLARNAAERLESADTLSGRAGP
jgi:hypothetical protein